MQDRASKRWDSAYTLYTGTLNEGEQKYRDYFETDMENYREDERLEEVRIFLNNLVFGWTRIT